MNMKGLGDYIYLDEYNAYITLLKQYANLQENISITGSTVEGVYATYKFNFPMTVLDYGVLIDKDKGHTQHNKIKIENMGLNSTYIMNLKLVKIEDYNLCIESSSDFKEYVSLPIEFTREENEVTLNLNDFDDGFVILFDVNVEIVNNIPEIVELEV